MKKICLSFLVFSCVIIAGCGSNKTIVSDGLIEDVSPATINIYALWDSITAGYQLPLDQSWPAQLQKMLQEKWFKGYKIINAGKSWDTSRQLKDRLERSISDAKTGDIAILTIWWNDWFQSVPVKLLEQNIRDIIDVLQKKWMKVIIWGMKISTNLWPNYTSAFEAIYPKIAADTQSILIPFVLTWVALVPQLNLPDMIHPNAAGYKIMAETILKTLQESNLIGK
jgi:acyl-CoA thioesterase I